MKKNKKKKILFLSNLDSFFISHRLEVGKSMLKEGYDVHIATEFTKYKNKLSKMGFKTHHINFNRNSLNLIKSIKPLLQIFLLYKNLNPNLVHHISLKPMVFGGFATLFTPIKSVVASVTGLGSIYLGNGIGFKIKKIIINLILFILFLKKNLRVIVQNYSDYKYLVNKTKIKKFKLVIIKGSGIDLKRFKYSKIKVKNPFILMASRLIADKGIYEYIFSIKHLKKSGFKGKFFLVGDIDFENPSAIKYSELNLWKKEKIINYHKHTNKIQNYIKKSSIVVLPSYREGFPKILLEAAACGRPVITTKVPGCKDAIINGKTGILIPPKNYIELAKAIKFLSTDKKRLKLMSRNSRKYAEQNFNVRNVVSKHIQIYKSLD